ncbi:MAG: BatD family protein [Leptospiraceae bacterium]|nr:BatD family protein [Leptospiraceae bacterium]
MNRLIFFLLLLSFPALADVKFYLSKTKLKRGEPLTLLCEINDSKQVKPSGNIFSANGVVAEYLGQEESTTIINFEVTKKRFLKYRIVTSKTGQLETPSVKITVDGNDVSSNPLTFNVSKEQFQDNDENELGEFFGNGFPNFPGFKPRKKRFQEPEPNDFKILFETTRKEIFVGETIVGYYNLYYKTDHPPLLERNASKALNFPFFTTEMLLDAVITADSRSISDSEFHSAPYQKEIFALTALRKGAFRVGETEFTIEGSPEAYFTARFLHANSSKLVVKPLPQGEPENFSGEVGNYKIEIESPKDSFKQGEPVHITLKIIGEGTGLLFKDPLENYCKETKCPADISLLNSKRKRSFVKLKNGGYGFQSETEFNYTIFTKQVGILDLGSVSVNFFNPNTSSYESSTKKFPKLKITEKSILSETDVSYQSDLYSYVILGLFLLSLGYLSYRFKDEFIEQVSKIELNLPFLKKFPQKLDDLDNIIGNKKELVLKNYFLSKGINKIDAEELIRIKKKYSYEPFKKFYPNLDKNAQANLLKLVNRILEEI